MKPFLFALRQEPSQRLDLSRLTPDRLVGRTQKEIEAIDIGTTKVDAKVGDLFKVRVGDPQVVHFEGARSASTCSAPSCCRALRSMSRATWARSSDAARKAGRSP